MVAVIIALVLGFPAHAGLRDWCARHLVSDDPFQYDGVSDDWLARERDRLSIKVVWGRATASDQAMLKIVEATIRRHAVARKMETSN